MAFSPIEHFEVNYLDILWLGGHSGMYLVIETVTFYIFLVLILLAVILSQLKKNITVLNKNNAFILLQTFYLFILNDIIKLQISSLRSHRYFPIILSIFLTIFILNVSSLSPYTVSVTGQLLITFSLSFILFLGIFFIAVLNHKLKFIQYFIPKDVPSYLKFFLTVIEFLSFIIRPFSLSIRLFANMLAGHTLLNIFGSFTYYVFGVFSLSFFIPFIFCSLIIVLELGVAVIQAYVFSILLAIYFNDVINLNH